MNIIDFSDVDKSKFKCLKFSDNSVYYGEIAYLDEFNNIVKDVDETKEDQLKHLKMVRNGLGVQLFNLTDTGYTEKYEGEFEKDKKHGHGVYIYADKSKYEGRFINDNYHGFGKFVWPNNNIYIGNWKNGRMDGEGEFIHIDGHILKGSFRNNYYYDNQRFINPFMGEEDMINFKDKNAQYVAKYYKADMEKFSRHNIFKANSQNELISFIEETTRNNKTPLIIRTRTNPLITKEEVLSMLNKKYKEIDLRHNYIKMREKSYHTDIMNKICDDVTEAANKGLYLVLNFDDCEVEYQYLFDPDIKEFYAPFGLSNFIFTPKNFMQKECIQSHFNKPGFVFDRTFKFIIYSKFLIDNDVQEHDLINFIEKRFEKPLPLKKLNVIIINKLN